MDSRGAAASHYRGGRLVVCCHGSDAVQTTNQKIEDISRRVQIGNRAATPAPPITEIVCVYDLEARSAHLILVHRLDYRPRRASAVGKVVAFSEPRYAAFHADKLQLATPAHYRLQEDLKPGIRDPHDGTLTKDGTPWASTIVSAGGVTRADLSFASSSEPWVYCASHYPLNRELRRLRDLFADEYGCPTATGISDPNAFAIRLGIDFALTFDKATEVKLEPFEEIGYALSRCDTQLWQGSSPLDTIVHVYHGPVHYEDKSGRIATQEDWFDPHAGPKAWFTKKTCFETQREYRFAVSTPGAPVEPKHYIAVSPELRELTSAL